MSAEMPSPNETVCWNCDRPAGALVPVVIAAPGAGRLRVRVCEACYRRAYLPLATPAPEPPAQATM